jgi:hypothetical protein
MSPKDPRQPADGRSATCRDTPGLAGSAHALDHAVDGGGDRLEPVSYLTDLAGIRASSRVELPGSKLRRQVHRHTTDSKPTFASGTGEIPGKPRRSLPTN